MRAHAVLVAIALLTACDYPRSAPLADDSPFDADPTAIDADPTAIDADLTAIDADPGAIDGPVGLLAVDLGSAGNYVILSKTAITGSGSTVTGSMGVGPAGGSYITGFSLMLDASGVFSTSTQVDGRIYAADYLAPTPAELTEAVLHMEAAYSDAAQREPDPDFIDLSSGSIGGLTLGPGVYRWNSGVTIPSDITLAGGPTDVWIFQIAEGLNLTNAATVALTGGARPEHVFWQAAGHVTLGTGSHLAGILLSRGATTGQSTTVRGRLLSALNITVAGSTVAQPVP